jgi:hypothetical protein
MWLMPMEAPLFITAKWAITTEINRLTNCFKQVIKRLTDMTLAQEFTPINNPIKAKVP